MSLRWLPNALTLSRWLVAPLVLLFSVRDYWWLATGLLFWASFSDMIDGPLARKFGVADSKLGAYLDRYGDILLVTCSALGLALNNPTAAKTTIFVAGYIAMILLGMGKKYLPAGSLRHMICSEVLRLYYLFALWLILLLYTIKAVGGMTAEIIILCLALTGIALYIRRDKLKAF